MDAVEFWKEKERMCKNCGQCDCCPISELNNDEGVFCTIYIEKYTEKAVEAVKKWSKEHPKSTRQNEFLRMFPETRMQKGIIDISPCDLEKSYRDEQGCCGVEPRYICMDCKKKYWLEEIE